MIRRELLVPVSPARLWEELTEPEAVRAWFGGEVEWELRPGGRLRVVEDDGTVRHGRVTTVAPERELRFQWWPGERHTRRLDAATASRTEGGWRALDDVGRPPGRHLGCHRARLRRADGLSPTGRWRTRTSTSSSPPWPTPPAAGSSTSSRAPAR